MAVMTRLERKSKCCRLFNNANAKMSTDLKSPFRGFFFIHEKGMISEGMKATGRRMKSELVTSSQAPESRNNKFSPDSAVRPRERQARWNPGVAKASNCKSFQSHFALSHFVVTNFTFRRSTVARRRLRGRRHLRHRRISLRLRLCYGRVAPRASCRAHPGSEQSQKRAIDIWDRQTLRNFNSWL
jgi:hypothetical protein